MKKLEKLEKFIKRNLFVIAWIHVALWLVAVFISIVLSNEVYCLKKEKETHSIVHQQIELMLNDSIVSEKYKKHKIELETHFYKLYQELLKSENRLKKIENETNKITNYYDSIIVNRPKF